VLLARADPAADGEERCISAPPVPREGGDPERVRICWKRADPVPDRRDPRRYRVLLGSRSTLSRPPSRGLRPVCGFCSTPGDLTLRRRMTPLSVAGSLELSRCSWRRREPNHAQVPRRVVESVARNDRLSVEERWGCWRASTAGAELDRPRLGRRLGSRGDELRRRCCRSPYCELRRPFIEPRLSSHVLRWSDSPDSV